MLIFLLSATPAYGDCITVFFFFSSIHHPSRLSSFRSIFFLIIILTFVLSFFGFIFLLSCSSFILFDFLQVIFILIMLLKYPLLTLISLYIDFEPFFFHHHYITYLAFRATVIWN